MLATYGGPASAVVDVGAGVSQLPDELLGAGWTDVTVLDVSPEAVATVQTRLAGRVGLSFVVADVLTWRPDRLYDVWHDRAVLHFLVDPESQQRYADTSAAALQAGGIAVLGVFAPDGPTQCSGLPTCQYDATTLSALCGSNFSLVHHEREEHRTPTGALQPFTWAVLRRL